MRNIKIAIASGKGGTGKTMIATSLAASLAPHFAVEFVDCDVEAPNAHLFLKPQNKQSFPAIILNPSIDDSRCSACGICVRICEFHALALIQKKVLVFPQLCHGCGSCVFQCQTEAISEEKREIGLLSQGTTHSGISFLTGDLTISEPMPTPVIRQLKSLSDPSVDITILDTSPGASCAVVATIHDADYVILVTEPTPFGLHDLKQILGILSKTSTPAGVIINRDGIGDNDLENFLMDKPYPVLMNIPFKEEIARGLAAGLLLIDVKPSYQEKLFDVFTQIKSKLEVTGNSS